MDYTITKDYDEVTIQNNDELETLVISLFFQTTCGVDEWEVIAEEQGFDDSISLPLLKDGIFKIILRGKDDVPENTLLYNYKELITTLIEDVKFILCGCHCSNCNDCDEDNPDYTSILTKILNYNILNNNLYDEYFSLTNDCIRCMIADVNQCIADEESITGKSDKSRLSKIIIAYYYLIFYYVDLKLSVNLATVKNLYEYTDIIKCIRRLGIDESCIQTAINED